MADTIYKELRKKLDLTREDVWDEASKRNQVLTYKRLERILKYENPYHRNPRFRWFQYS